MHVFVRPEERSLETCNDGMIIRARTHAGGLYALLLKSYACFEIVLPCMFWSCDACTACRRSS